MADLPADSADVVVGDAFGSRAVPWHLATVEFAGEIDRVLRPGGVYVLNVIDGGDQAFLRAEAATIAAVFPHVSVVLGSSATAGRLGNSVVIASDRPFDPTVVDTENGRLVDDVDAFSATRRSSPTTSRPSISCCCGRADRQVGSVREFAFREPAREPCVGG